MCQRASSRATTGWLSQRVRAVASLSHSTSVGPCLSQVALVAMNIIGDPADFGDESSLVSWGSAVSEEENLFLTGGKG